jgi:hypothetical protein
MRAALGLAAAGLAIECAAIVGFWLGGRGVDLWPLSLLTLLQAALLTMLAMRRAGFWSLTACGLLAVAVGLAWTAFKPHEIGPCCPPPQPFGGAWLMAAVLSGILDLLGAAAFLLDRRPNSLPRPNFRPR